MVMGVTGARSGACLQLLYMLIETRIQMKQDAIEMTGEERIISALRLETPDQVPTFEWFVDSIVGEALVGSTDPVEIVEKLELDGINIRADYRREQIDETTFTDEWGVTRRVTPDCIPAVLASPISDITRHVDYVFPDPAADHRFESLAGAYDKLGGKQALILNLRDGWSDMRDLLGYEDSLMNLLLEPEHFASLLDRVVDYNLALARAAVERYDIRIIATTDDIANANGLLVPPAKYFELIAPAFAKAVKGYKDLDCYCIKHCDGDVTPLIEFWIEAGIDCIDPIDPTAGMKMAEFKQKYGDKICLKGNIDCTGALCDGTEEDVEEEVKICLAEGGKNGLILSSSNTIHRGVKPANYLAMLKALRCYGAQS